MTEPSLEPATPADEALPPEPAGEDDVNVHAPQGGDLEAEFKERIEEILQGVEQAVTKVRDKLAGYEAGALHEVHDAMSELRGVTRLLVPSQTLLKTPSPSLDPDHPQGLGRTLQEGETLQTGVI